MRAYRFEDLEDLLRQDWLKRGWTYQEIILACNPVIVCGNKSMTWDNFIRGIEYLLFLKDCSERLPTFGLSNGTPGKTI